MKATLITLTYLAVMIWLLFKFPLVIISLIVIMIISFAYMIYKAPFDDELWPDIYKE